MHNTTAFGLKMLRRALTAYAFAAASSALAEGPRTIPTSAQFSGGYLSTTLLLKPCMDIHEWSEDPREDVRRQFEDAQRGLPPGTCDEPALAEKLSTARFLQYASITAVHDPWNLDAKITAQNAAIARCKDVQCLERELNVVITELSPVYLHSRPEWPRGVGLCTSKTVEVTPGKARALIGTKAQKALVDRCAPESLSVQTCQGPRGKFVFASCTMSGNQVNSSEWLYRIANAKPEPLLAVDDGPLGALTTSCNGMPDLITSARVSMAEHYLNYYRYDGTEYQSVYAYSSIYVGTDDNGNDLTIAQGGPDTRVACR